MMASSKGHTTKGEPILCFYRRIRYPMNISRFIALKLPDYSPEFVILVTISVRLL